jgi:hypothetical protein
MALWFEAQVHFDFPDTDVLLPSTSLGLNAAEPDVFDEVYMILNCIVELVWFCNVVVQPSRAGTLARSEQRAPAIFEYSSLPPGIPHYIFEIVLELIKDNEPHEDILAM